MTTITVVGSSTEISPSGSSVSISSKLTPVEVTQANLGPKGDPGDSVDSLEPRVSALEEETDGLVSGADPLSYYILAKST